MAADSWKLKPGTTWRDKLQDVHPNHGKIVRRSSAFVWIEFKDGIEAARRKPRDLFAIHSYFRMFGAIFERRKRGATPEAYRLLTGSILTADWSGQPHSEI